MHHQFTEMEDAKLFETLINYSAFYGHESEDFKNTQTK
jgi:hypothetical protein